MELKQLIFGIGSILREQVDGWAVSQSGVPHVYPDHPPLDLSRSSYPRAAIDAIGHSSGPQDIEDAAEVNNVLVDVTVYATNSSDVLGLVGDVHTAIPTYADETDQNGDEYLANWWYDRTGNTSNLIEDEANDGFTRYSKTVEFHMSGVTQTTV